MSVFPVIDGTGKFAEIDFGVKVCREVFAVVARVDIDDVDRLDLIHHVDGKARIGVHNARIKARAQDRGHTFFCAKVAFLPFIVRIPRRGFANLVGLFVNGRVDIGGTGFDTAVQHVHVHKRRADVDHNVHAGLADQIGHSGGIRRIDLMGLKNALLFHRALFADRLKDRFAFRERPAGDMDIPKHIVVLRAFMRHDLSDATRADDKNVLFQLKRPPWVLFSRQRAPAL